MLSELLTCAKVLLLLAWLQLLLLFLLFNMLNFLTCLTLTLPYLSSLTLLMNLLHLSNSVVLVTMDANLDLLLLMVFIVASVVLLIHFTLPCNSCLSAFSIIFWPLD